MSENFSFIGAAEAYIDILDDTGSSTGLSLKGNCTEFTPKIDAETKEMTGNAPHNFGQVIASVTIPKPMKATIKFNQLDQELFAASFLGISSRLSQQAGTITDKAVTLKTDKWVELGKYMVSAVVVKKGGTTYEEGKDYRVNDRLGMVCALAGGAIADGAEVTVSCSYGQVAGSTLAAMTRSNIRIRIKLDGQNFADGRRFVSEVYRMRLAPSSDFSFIGTDFAEATFEGTLETPAGKTAAFEHIWLG